MSANIAEIREQVRDLQRDIQATKREAVELNDLLTTYVALARRCGLAPEIMDLIAKAQQARIAVLTLTRAIQIFYTTSGPLGWLLAAGGIALSAFMVVDIMELQRPQY